jgi:soluble lytic murein transglycosylase-like protein
MRHRLIVPLVLVVASCCWAGTSPTRDRDQAEYYVTAYARHYGVPLQLVRSIVQQESGWHSCVVSSKGAVGLMQIMPTTAQGLGVRNRCNIDENVSGGVRYLAWLIRKFHGDLRLVAAAYYAGEHVIAKRGLNYQNPQVIAYVAQVRAIYEQQKTDQALERPSSGRRRKSQ